jgi:hypothetical protein
MGSGSRNGAAGSRSADAGLLFLRVVAGTSLLLKHVLEKPEHLMAMAQHFPNPPYILGRCPACCLRWSLKKFAMGAEPSEAQKVLFAFAIGQ